jgi:hypothetical protein
MTCKGGGAKNNNFELWRRLKKKAENKTICNKIATISG